MRIIGLLSWYDENPSWLAECVASAARLVDHLVAVDGPYALFPDSTRKPASGPEQAETIARTAAGAGVGVTVHTPRTPWWGNEVEKRDFMFRVGETIADPGDWHLVIDADEVLAQVPSDTRGQLDATDAHVAAVTLWERNTQEEVAAIVDASPDYRTSLRRLFRAQPGLRIVQAHYVVVTADSRVLAGNTATHDLQPALPLPDVVLEHRTRQRTPYRLRQKAQFTRDRDDTGVEKVGAL